MDEIMEILRKFSYDRDWEKFHTFKNLSMSIAIEAAELMECFQWSPIAIEKHNSIFDEIADIFIYLIIFCDKYELCEKEVYQIIKNKIEKNAIKYPVTEETI